MDVTELDPTDTEISGDDGEDEANLEARAEGDAEETEFLFGDEAAPASGERDTGLVKQLRNVIREKDRQIAEARRGVTEEALPPKPTLESCGYDEALFDDEYEKWTLKKVELSGREQEARQREIQEQEAWEAKSRAYETAKARLPYEDVEDAENVVVQVLSVNHRGVLIKASENPAQLMYALAKRPDKLAQFSAIKDPIEAAAFIARMEGNMKVVTKRQAPAPEKIAGGNASVNLSGSQQKLEQLRSKARDSGNWDEFYAYKRNLQAA